MLWLQVILFISVYVVFLVLCANIYSNLKSTESSGNRVDKCPEWSAWSECSTECGSGISTRTRGSILSCGVSTDFRGCNSVPCAKMCNKEYSVEYEGCPADCSLSVDTDFSLRSYDSVSSHGAKECTPEIVYNQCDLNCDLEDSTGLKFLEGSMISVDNLPIAIKMSTHSIDSILQLNDKASQLVLEFPLSRLSFNTDNNLVSSTPIGAQPLSRITYGTLIEALKRDLSMIFNLNDGELSPFLITGVSLLNMNVNGHSEGESIQVLLSPQFNDAYALDNYFRRVCDSKGTFSTISDEDKFLIYSSSISQTLNAKAGPLQWSSSSNNFSPRLLQLLPGDYRTKWVKTYYLEWSVTSNIRQVLHRSALAKSRENYYPVALSTQCLSNADSMQSSQYDASVDFNKNIHFCLDSCDSNPECLCINYSTDHICTLVTGAIEKIDISMPIVAYLRRPPDNSTVCGTLEWSEWSVCSNSCGIGIRTRTLNGQSVTEMPHMPMNCDTDGGPVAACYSHGETPEVSNVCKRENRFITEDNCNDGGIWSPWTMCTECGYSFEKPSKRYPQEQIYVDRNTHMLMLGQLSKSSVGRKSRSYVGTPIGDRPFCREEVPCVEACGVIDIASGKEFTCTLLDIGQVICWGKNDYYQLGRNNQQMSYNSLHYEVDDAMYINLGIISTNENNDRRTSNFLLPLELAQNIEQNGSYQPIDLPVRIYAGGYHACALFLSNRLKCWGRNDSGQTGRYTDLKGYTSPMDLISGGYISFLPPTISYVRSTGTFPQVALGDRHTCVILGDSDHSIQCFGDNSLGQLGIPSSVPHISVTDFHGNINLSQFRYKVDDAVQYMGVYASGNTTCSLLRREAWSNLSPQQEQKYEGVKYNIDCQGNTSFLSPKNETKTFFLSHENIISHFNLNQTQIWDAVQITDVQLFQEGKKLCITAQSNDSPYVNTALSDIMISLKAYPNSTALETSLPRTVCYPENSKIFTQSSADKAHGNKDSVYKSTVYTRSFSSSAFDPKGEERIIPLSYSVDVGLPVVSKEEKRFIQRGSLLAFNGPVEFSPQSYTTGYEEKELKQISTYTNSSVISDRNITQGIPLPLVFVKNVDIPTLQDYSNRQATILKETYGVEGSLPSSNSYSALPEKYPNISSISDSDSGNYAADLLTPQTTSTAIDLTELDLNYQSKTIASTLLSPLRFFPFQTMSKRDNPTEYAGCCLHRKEGKERLCSRYYTIGEGTGYLNDPAAPDAAIVEVTVPVSCVMILYTEGNTFVIPPVPTVPLQQLFQGGERSVNAIQGFRCFCEGAESLLRDDMTKPLPLSSGAFIKEGIPQGVIFLGRNYQFERFSTKSTSIHNEEKTFNRHRGIESQREIYMKTGDFFRTLPELPSSYSGRGCFNSFGTYYKTILHGKNDYTFSRVFGYGAYALGGKTFGEIEGRSDAWGGKNPLEIPLFNLGFLPGSCDVRWYSEDYVASTYSSHLCEVRFPGYHVMEKYLRKNSNAENAKKWHEYYKPRDISDPSSWMEENLIEFFQPEVFQYGYGGMVFCIGENMFGQLGIGTAYKSKNRFTAANLPFHIQQLIHKI